MFAKRGGGASSIFASRLLLLDAQVAIVIRIPSELPNLQLSRRILGSSDTPHYDMDTQASAILHSFLYTPTSARTVRICSSVKPITVCTHGATGLLLAGGEGVC